MVKIELNKKSTNPFYGLKNCLSLYQNGSKGNVSAHQLSACWTEVQADKEKRQMFFALLFSIGDITARQHNIFRKNKVDSGGSAKREAFVTILEWLRTYNYPQYKRFLFANLFNEFVSFDSIFINRVKTTKGKKKVESVTSSLTGTPEYLNDLADFVVRTIQGNNPSNKYFLAKFLTRPRLSKRKGHKQMLPETRRIMKAKEAFLALVSEKAGMEVLKKSGHLEFKGYINWRKEYIGDIESVLFASGKVKEFDEQAFLAWLDKLPASARYRVRCRVLDKTNKVKDKWGSIGTWFLTWEKFKEGKQTEVRVLEEKIRQTPGNQDEVAKLTELKKEAKVTTGAVQFDQMFKEIILGAVDKLKIQPFLDKVSLPFNFLVFIDDSGSMRQGHPLGFSAFDFATFMATICLTKNPDDTGRSLIGFYSREARLYATMTSKASMPNTLVRATVKTISEPLIDGKKHFLENLQRMREFAMSVMTQNGTDISSIPDYIYKQLQGDSTMMEQLQAMPVWVIITDGNWNQMHSPEASLNNFFSKCQGYFGYKPFIIAIDAASHSSADVTRFDGIENFMFVPPNPAQIEQLLTNFKDMDIMDVYTPLQSFYRSNRYDMVKAATI